MRCAGTCDHPAPAFSTINPCSRSTMPPVATPVPKTGRPSAWSATSFCAWAITSSKAVAAAIPECGTSTEALATPSSPVSTIPVTRGPRWIPITKFESVSTLRGTLGRPCPAATGADSLISRCSRRLAAMLVTEATLMPMAPRCPCASARAPRRSPGAPTRNSWHEPDRSCETCSDEPFEGPIAPFWLALLILSPMKCALRIRQASLPPRQLVKSLPASHRCSA